MSDTTNEFKSASSSGEKGGQLVLIILGLIALAAAVYFFSRPTDIDRSVLGMKGFARAAKTDGKLDIHFFEGKSTLVPATYGLRILPLYDPNIFGNLKPEDRNLNNDEAQTLRRLSQTTFQRKINSINTLVILPKWRAGVLRLEQLHPDLLIDISSFKLPYGQRSGLGEPEIRRQKAGFQQETLDWGKRPKINWVGKRPAVELYAAQTLSDDTLGPQNCLPAARFQQETILARCAWQATDESRSGEFWLLTDPDILNNHGAKNAGNFEFGVKLVSILAAGRPIIVDGTNRVFLQRSGSRDNRERSFSDLARFFEYPFSLFWGALFGLVFFGLWHSWRREGPILDGEETNKAEASKATAIEASVTILRGTQKNSARDHALAQKHVAQRMRAFSTDILGNNIVHSSTAEEQALAVLSRRNSVLALELTRASTEFSMAEATTPTNSLIDRLNHFEKTLKEARHEFGRPAKALR